MVNNQPIGFTGTSSVTRATRKVLTPEISEGRHSVKPTRTRTEIESALRLRHDVFNVELAAAPFANAANAIECDRCNAVCQHLLVVDNLTGQTAGTCRLNPVETARTADGFYASNEFGTINFFAPFDLREMHERCRKLFFR